MPRTTRIASLVMLIGALAAASPAYSAEHATPPASGAAPGTMQEGGDMQGTGMEGMESMESTEGMEGMEGMEGTMSMMNMMEQMNKMMTLCTKMMEGMMANMDQQSGPAETP